VGIHVLIARGCPRVITCISSIILSAILSWKCQPEEGRIRRNGQENQKDDKNTEVCIPEPTSIDCTSVGKKDGRELMTIEHTVHIEEQSLSQYIDTSEFMTATEKEGLINK